MSDKDAPPDPQIRIAQLEAECDELRRRSRVRELEIYLGEMLQARSERDAVIAKAADAHAAVARVLGWCKDKTPTPGASSEFEAIVSAVKQQVASLVEGEKTHG